MILHPELRDKIEQQYAKRLAGHPVVAQDALTLTFDNGLVVELRYANANEYSVQWRWHEAWLRIDTAPLHRDVGTFPNHLHDASSAVKSDPLTMPGRDPWDNVRSVLDAILERPLLG